jgi:AP-1 complex subunit beta-1
VKICDNKNYPQVLNELGIYINEADPEFVRRTVKALGKIGLRYDKSVEK